LDEKDLLVNVIWQKILILVLKHLLLQRINDNANDKSQNSVIFIVILLLLWPTFQYVVLNRFILYFSNNKWTKYRYFSINIVVYLIELQQQNLNIQSLCSQIRWSCTKNITQQLKHNKKAVSSNGSSLSWRKLQGVLVSSCLCLQKCILFQEPYLDNVCITVFFNYHCKFLWIRM
jgi:hypothetical protein